MHAGIAFVRRIVWDHDGVAPYERDVCEAVVRSSLVAFLAVLGLPLLGAPAGLLVVTAELQVLELSGIDIEVCRGPDGIVR